MIKVELNKEELQSLVALIDAAVRASGVSSVKTAAIMIAKFEMAVAEANAAQPEVATE